MATIISTIIQYVSTFLWCCSQPVYFLIYIFETNYELISAVFTVIYTCLALAVKVCYLLIYGLAATVEYILFTLMAAKDPLIMIVSSIISLAKIIFQVPVYVVRALQYIPLLVTGLSDGIVQLVASITHCYNVLMDSTSGILQTFAVILEYLKAMEMVCYNFLAGTTVNALTRLMASLWNMISEILASVKGAVFDCRDALQKLELFQASATLITKFVIEVHKHLYNGIFIAFHSFSDIFLTFLELVSYIVIFAAVFILLVTAFVKVYAMYSNAMNSANSLMNIFRSSVLFGTRRDMRQNPGEPLVRLERVAQEDTESDVSLMDNDRNRVFRRPRHGEEPGLHLSRPSRVSTQTRNEEHRPSSSGKHSQTQTSQPSHSSRQNVYPGQMEVARLAKQLEEEQDRLLCVVCQDKTKNTLILPCKHLCVCQDCVEAITDHRGSKKCPLCRGRISSYLEVYA